LPMLAVFLAIGGIARADGPWSGYWATTWRDGGARILPDPRGDRVTGTPPLYGGHIEATAKGSRLEGQWSQADGGGGFVIVMGRDGNSFSGRYNTGEWWTGVRSTAPGSAASFDLTSPREAFRRFIIYCNLGRSIQPDAWGCRRSISAMPRPPCRAPSNLSAYATCSRSSISPLSASG
ncbi:MAG TPA: hypothetical protein VGH36_11180, partial [Acetobacteraceae bacterium]